MASKRKKVKLAAKQNDNPQASEAQGLEQVPFSFEEIVAALVAEKPKQDKEEVA